MLDSRYYVPQSLLMTVQKSTAQLLCFRQKRALLAVNTWRMRLLPRGAILIWYHSVCTLCNFKFTCIGLIAFKALQAIWLDSFSQETTAGILLTL